MKRKFDKVGQKKLIKIHDKYRSHEVRKLSGITLMNHLKTIDDGLEIIKEVNSVIKKIKKVGKRNDTSKD